MDVTIFSSPTEPVCSHCICESNTTDLETHKECDVIVDRNDYYDQIIYNVTILCKIIEHRPPIKSAVNYVWSCVFCFFVI